MTRGISDPAPINEPQDSNSQDDGQPSSKEILAYLDDLSDFIREIDIRLATLEKFAIKEISQNTTPPPRATLKNFLTGK